ncbi:hypothetical protein [Peribacillus simplex]|nr:hypothetical protein [Peribacillus simplex]WHY97581.1 hypothetical protein QNH37_27265 [Peribacillus simplex]
MYIGELICYSGACTSILLDMQEPKTGPANMGIPIFTLGHRLSKHGT